MRIVIAMILLVGFTIAGCAPAKLYTFKRDRVDQDMTGGNRGYAQEAPPVATQAEKTPQRTLIGLDLEIGLLPSEKKKVEKIETEERLPEKDLETTRQVFPPPEKVEKDEVK